MSSGLNLQNPNELAATSGPLLSVLGNPDAKIVLAAIGVLLTQRGLATTAPLAQEDLASALEVTPESIAAILTQLSYAGLVEIAGELVTTTDRGARWLVRVGTDLTSMLGASVGGRREDVADPLQGSYDLVEILGTGGTSVTFRGIQQLTSAERAVKVVYPGYTTIDQLRLALEKRQTIHHLALPQVLDAGTIEGNRFGFPGDPVAIVLECVNSEAVTFQDFLQTEFYSAPHLLSRFISEVGGALHAIQRAGLEHGDLHGENILVVADDRGNPSFRVIDFVGLALRPSPHSVPLDDTESFFQHLLTAVMIAHEREPELPLRRLLGEHVWRIVRGIEEGQVSTIGEVLDLLVAELPPAAEVLRPARTRPFEWLRVESVPAPADLMSLFEPSVGRFEEVSEFGNMWISGPRGCGKSHYVRVLAFYPELERARLAGDTNLRDEYLRLGLNFRDQFGVFVPCRVGTFKAFTPDVIGRDTFDSHTVAVLKDILVLTIMSHTLAALVDGCPKDGETETSSPLGYPRAEMRVQAFWEARRGRKMVQRADGQIARLVQLRDAVDRELLRARLSWHRRHPAADLLMDEQDLNDFFVAVSDTFDVLKGTRYQVIFDDVTHGIVHFELQKVLNSLVRSAGERHCFKITSEKYQYTLDSSDGRAVEFPHDAEFCDLGELASGATKDAPGNYRQYLEAVVDRRLEYGGWNRRIVDIVGESQRPAEFLSGLRSTYRVEDAEFGGERARYGGWNILCHLAHGSVRNLLEMLEQVFSVAGGTAEAVKLSPIPLLIQDQAVKEYSLGHWRELERLPGRIGEIRIGPQLQAIASALGEMSRRLLLHYESSVPYEALSVERLDPGRPLSSEAEGVLDAALRYGVLVETGAGFSRAQKGLTSRVDLNKMYTPAFRTTYRIRNHIYLSGLEFEELLLRPGELAHRRNARPVPRPPQDELPL